MGQLQSVYIQNRIAGEAYGRKEHPEYDISCRKLFSFNQGRDDLIQQEVRDYAQDDSGCH
jgi:hypothetical protein